MGKAGFLLVGERGQSPFFPLSDLNVVENFDQAHEGQTCDCLHLVISCHLWRAANAGSVANDQYGDLFDFVWSRLHFRRLLHASRLLNVDVPPKRV